jgi:hypothetical protein
MSLPSSLLAFVVERGAIAGGSVARVSCESVSRQQTQSKGMRRVNTPNDLRSAQCASAI